MRQIIQCDVPSGMDLGKILALLLAITMTLSALTILYFTADLLIWGYDGTGLCHHLPEACILE